MVTACCVHWCLWCLATWVDEWFGQTMLGIVVRRGRCSIVAGTVVPRRVAVSEEIKSRRNITLRPGERRRADGSFINQRQARRRDLAMEHGWTMTTDWLCGLAGVQACRLCCTPAPRGNGSGSGWSRCWYSGAQNVPCLPCRAEPASLRSSLRHTPLARADSLALHFSILVHLACCSTLGGCKMLLTKDILSLWMGKPGQTPV